MILRNSKRMYQILMLQFIAHAHIHTIFQVGSTRVYPCAVFIYEHHHIWTKYQGTSDPNDPKT